jgi:hypothetical protein
MTSSASAPRSSDMAEPEDDTPRKGRSNAILTYEKIAEFQNTLTAVATMVAGLKEAVTGSVQKAEALELRLRMMEVEFSAFKATLANTKDLSRYWQTTLISLAALVVGVMGTYIAMAKGLK